MVLRQSPWLAELFRSRPVESLSDSAATDVAVVGGGISGMMAAHQLLERTDLDITLLEAGLVANGATGHNGGQVVAAFERRYAELAERFGEERAANGYREVRDGWPIMEGVLKEIGTPGLLQEVVGELGISSPSDLPGWAEEMKVRKKLGLPAGALRVSSDVRTSAEVEEVAELAYRDEIEDLLWSRDHRYLAAAEVRVGTVNSAVMTEALAGYLLAEYPGRVRILERSLVDRIRLSDEGGALSSNGHTLFADRIVLCTNGYTAPSIEACVTPALLGHVQGVVGYMVGAVSSQGMPGARAYFRGPGGGPYYYLTRRRYRDQWLTAVGGPEDPLQAKVYDPDVDYDPRAYDRIIAFLRSTIAGEIGPVEMRWQGLMGYTSSGVRLVGRDPGHPALYYNLGCNGIGLLSAAAGAKRVADEMNGEELPPSMFDPELIAPKKRAEAQRTR